MLEGTVKAWKPDGGFGFIRPRNRHDADVIFFVWQLPAGRVPLQGERVEYEVIRDRRRSADRAASVVIK